MAHSCHYSLTDRKNANKKVEIMSASSSSLQRVAPPPQSTCVSERYTMARSQADKQVKENQRQCCGVLVEFSTTETAAKIVGVKDRSNTLETAETCDSSTADEERNECAQHRNNDDLDHIDDDLSWYSDNEDNSPWDYSDVSFDIDDDTYFLDESEFSQVLVGYADDEDDYGDDFYGSSNSTENDYGNGLSRAARARRDFSMARIPPAIAEVESFDSC